MNAPIAVMYISVIFVVEALVAEDLWLVFKENHGRTYKSLLEEKIRFTNFKANLLKIEKHNERYEREEESYFLKITPHADLTEEEFRRELILNSQGMPNFTRLMSGSKVVRNLSNIPDSLDWKDKGVVSEVKNQKQCGSCWAFSATGALEGQNAIKNKVLLPLSEQQLLDCSSSYGNGDCQVGGLMNFAFDYIKDHGIESEQDYPYEAKMVKCRAVGSKSRIKLKAYKWVGRTEENLRKSVATVGPISVSLDATYFHLYGGGIFDKKSCSSTDANHAVLLVGYGRHRNKDYWLIKNSWSTSWGEKGYMRMIRNAHNQCGIANGAIYPEID